MWAPRATQYKVEILEGPQMSLPFGCHIEVDNGGRGGRPEGAGVSGAVWCGTPGTRALAVYLHIPGPFWRGGWRD